MFEIETVERLIFVMTSVPLMWPWGWRALRAEWKWSADGRWEVKEGRVWSTG